jgi:hypothetical protein
MLRNITIAFTGIIAIAFIFSGCGSSNNSDKTTNDSISVKPKVSVYYLHQKKRCATCKAVGSISKTTTEKNFANEIKEGKVAFFDLDISEPANDSIAKKFECTWSGLYILSDNNGKEVTEDLTDVGFMYAVNNPDTLEQIIRSTIAEKL